MYKKVQDLAINNKGIRTCSKLFKVFYKNGFAYYKTWLNTFLEKKYSKYMRHLKLIEKLKSLENGLGKLLKAPAKGKRFVAVVQRKI